MSESEFTSGSEIVRKNINIRYVDPYNPFLYISERDTDMIVLPNLSNFEVLLFHFRND
jgi:hypothetical protein